MVPRLWVAVTWSTPYLPDEKTCLILFRPDDKEYELYIQRCDVRTI